MSTATDPTGVDIPTKRTYLKTRQIKDYEDEVTRLEGMVKDPRSKIENMAEMNSRVKQLKETLHHGAPPDTTPVQRDALAKEERELREQIQSEMLSQEELRKCPPGAIGAELKFQRRNKSKIIRWKNIMRTLHKGDDDPDISNMEKFRGTVNRLNMDNAIVEGKQHFLSPNTEAYKEGYERIWPSEEAKRVQELEAKLARIEKLLGDQIKSSAEKPSGESVREVSDADKPFEAVAACGRVVKARSQHRATFGKNGHERGCDKCKEIKGE